MATLVWAPQSNSPTLPTQPCSLLKIQSGWGDVNRATANKSRQSGRREMQKRLGAAAEYRPRVFFHAYRCFLSFCFLLQCCALTTRRVAFCSASMFAMKASGRALRSHIVVTSRVSFRYQTLFGDQVEQSAIAFMESRVAWSLFMETRVAWSFPSSTSRVV